MVFLDIQISLHQQQQQQESRGLLKFDILEIFLTL